jgi:hypothetical protein
MCVQRAVQLTAISVGGQEGSAGGCFFLARPKRRRQIQRDDRSADGVGVSILLANTKARRQSQREGGSVRDVLGFSEC